MDTATYLDQLIKRIEPYFDIKKNEKTTLPFVLLAELNVSDEGYFLIHKLKTYSVKRNEYLYVVLCNEMFTQALADNYISYIKEIMQNLKTTPEHMSSLFSLVFIAPAGFDNGTKDYLCRFKYHKDYFFTLKGWSDLAIYSVDLLTNQVHTNKAGRNNLRIFTL